ncbi:MAG: hypothetical protein ABIJ27_05265 [Candidatus Omnitrophota bacterium]
MTKLKAIVICSIFLAQTITPYRDSYAAVRQAETYSGDTRNGRTVDVENLKIPARLGEVKDVLPGKSARTIIHIRDAHCNYSAQRSIADLIGYLNDTYGIDLVGLEGGSGNYDLSVFTNIPNKEARRNAADYFVREGEVSGAESYGINNPENVTLYGIENAAYYMENLNTYRDYLKAKDDIEKCLKTIEHIENNLKLKMFSDELRAQDERATQYKAKEITFKEYALSLADLSKKLKVDMSAVPNIASLFKLFIVEDEIDFKKAGRERSGLLDMLGDKLSKKKIEELVLRSAAFNAGDIPKEEYYSFLFKRARLCGVDFKELPNLVKYAEFINEYERLDKRAFFREIGVLEGLIFAALCKDNDQKTLCELSRNLSIIQGMFDIDLTKEDWDLYNQRKDSFRTGLFLDFFKKHCPRYGFTFKIDDDLARLDGYRETMEKFFLYSLKRDDAFIENIDNKLRETGKTTTVIVTGGFHADNLKKLFQGKSYSYVGIYPKMKASKDTPYFRLLSGGMDPLMKAILPERSAIAIAAYLSPGLADDAYDEAQVEAFDLAVKILRDFEENGEKELRAVVFAGEMAKTITISGSARKGIKVSTEDMGGDEARELVRSNGARGYEMAPMIAKAPEVEDAEPRASPTAVAEEEPALSRTQEANVSLTPQEAEAYFGRAADTDGLREYLMQLSRSQAGRDPIPGKEEKARLYVTTERAGSLTRKDNELGAEVGFPVPVVGELWGYIEEENTFRKLEEHEILERLGLRRVMEGGVGVDVNLAIPLNSDGSVSGLRMFYTDQPSTLVMLPDGSVKQKFFGHLTRDQVAERSPIRESETIVYGHGIEFKGIGMTRILMGRGDGFNNTKTYTGEEFREIFGEIAGERLCRLNSDQQRSITGALDDFYRKGIVSSEKLNIQAFVQKKKRSAFERFRDLRKYRYSDELYTLTVITRSQTDHLSRHEETIAGEERLQDRIDEIAGILNLSASEEAMLAATNRGAAARVKFRKQREDAYQVDREIPNGGVLRKTSRVSSEDQLRAVVDKLLIAEGVRNDLIARAEGGEGDAQYLEFGDGRVGLRKLGEGRYEIIREVTLQDFSHAGGMILDDDLQYQAFGVNTPHGAVLFDSVWNEYLKGKVLWENGVEPNTINIGAAPLNAFPDGHYKFGVTARVTRGARPRTRFVSDIRPGLTPKLPESMDPEAIATKRGKNTKASVIGNLVHFGIEEAKGKDIAEDGTDTDYDEYVPLRQGIEDQMLTNHISHELEYFVSLFWIAHPELRESLSFGLADDAIIDSEEFGNYLYGIFTNGYNEGEARSLIAKVRQELRDLREEPGGVIRDKDGKIKRFRGETIRQEVARVILRNWNEYALGRERSALIEVRRDDLMPEAAPRASPSGTGEPAKRPLDRARDGSRDGELVEPQTRELDLRASPTAESVIREKDFGGETLQMVAAEGGTSVQTKEEWGEWIQTMHSADKEMLGSFMQGFGNEPSVIGVPIPEEKWTEQYPELILGSIGRLRVSVEGAIIAYNLGERISVYFYRDNPEGRSRLMEKVDGTGRKGRVVTFVSRNEDGSEREEFLDRDGGLPLRDRSYVVNLDYSLTIGEGSAFAIPFGHCGILGLAFLNYFNLRENNAAGEDLDSALRMVALGIARLAGQYDTDFAENLFNRMKTEDIVDLIKSGELIVQIRPIDPNEIPEFHRAEAEVMKAL